MFSTRTRTVVLVILIVAAVITLLTFRRYQLDLIESIVASALVQKAGHSVTEQEIRRVFRAARASAENSRQHAAYAERLLAISQRLEKVQELQKSQVEQILSSVSEKAGISGHR